MFSFGSAGALWYFFFFLRKTVNQVAPPPSTASAAPEADWNEAPSRVRLAIASALATDALNIRTIVAKKRFIAGKAPFRFGACAPTLLRSRRRTARRLSRRSRAGATGRCACRASSAGEDRGCRSRARAGRGRRLSAPREG